MEFDIYLKMYVRDIISEYLQNQHGYMVNAFNGRKGEIVPEFGDYNVSQIIGLEERLAGHMQQVEEMVLRHIAQDAATRGARLELGNTTRKSL